VLVSNAAVGVTPPGTKTRFQMVFDANVVGTAVTADAFRPLLLKSPKPYSIYVSSGAGSMGLSSDPTWDYYKSPVKDGEAYRASKAALNMIALQE
jgi:NAD(P)-dependent dehydrogenase (short-subunit alcohol dehydrogenase family)